MIDFKVTFSLVIRFTSICLIGLELYQMDDKTKLLNEKLDEKIYIE